MTQHTPTFEATDTPIGSLRERALAAVAAQQRKWDEAEARRLADNLEREVLQMLAARAPIARRFGIDIDWTPAAGQPGIEIDGLWLKPGEPWHEPGGWGLQVSQPCPDCTNMRFAEGIVTSLYDLGNLYQQFPTRFYHECDRILPTATDPDDLPFDDEAPARSDDAFFDFIIAGLRARGVVLDGGTL